jgi:hypothetical protein
VPFSFVPLQATGAFRIYLSNANECMWNMHKNCWGVLTGKYYNSVSLILVELCALGGGSCACSAWCMRRCVYPAHRLTFDLSVVNNSHSSIVLPRSAMLQVTAYFGTEPSALNLKDFMDMSERQERLIMGSLTATMCEV